MPLPPPHPQGATLRATRRLLAATLLVGMIGTGTELLLIGHVESASQYAPLLLIGIGLLVVGRYLAAPGAAARRAMQVVMLAFVVSGAVGVGLHMHGNKEFELEMSPSRSGWDLVKKIMTGATPVLAPGSMTLLGLIGLAQIHEKGASQS
jgi:hypothetical protein